jgi:outer membrane protein assembly factor BamB
MWSPTVAGDRVYVGGGREWYNTLFCFNALTGTLLWRYETDDDIGSAAPAVAYGRVYVGDRDGWIYCLDAVTGTLLWRYRAGHDIHRRIDLSSPAVVEGRVYVGCWDNQLYCLDAFDGTLHWTFKTWGIIDSSPAVVGGKVYLGAVDTNVYCLDAVTGTQIWNYTTNDIIKSSPAIAHGRVYVGSRDANVYCLNATTGTHIWNYETDGAVYASPAVAGDRVYVGSYDNRIYCLDAETGTVLWTYKTGDYVFSSPAIADGRVYIGSLDNKIYAFGDRTEMNPFDVNGTVLQVSVVSNSQISDISFDHSSRDISFTATGTPGTPAFANITFPNTLLKPESVLEDGSPISPIKTSNATHTSLYIEYEDNLHTIRIIGTKPVSGYPRIEVDPLTIVFPRSYPIDYPRLLNETIITNEGDAPLSIRSLTLTLNEGGTYSIDAIYREGRLGAFFNASPPFLLESGESAYVRVSWHPFEVEQYRGILEIQNNDPDNPYKEVHMSGAGTSASGVGTVITEQTSPSREPGEEGRWILPIDLGAYITGSEIRYTFNIDDYSADLTSDDRGIVLEGMLKHPEMLGQLILEMKYTNSTEKQSVYEIIILPSQVVSEACIIFTALFLIPLCQIWRQTQMP